MTPEVRLIAGGMERVHTGSCLDGKVQVTDTYTSIIVKGKVVAWSLSLRDLTLDGERVFYPRSAELAAAAGIEDAPPFIEVNEQPHSGVW